MTLSASEKLHRFFDLFSAKGHVLILIEADPDSIASAMAVKRLLWRKVDSVTISNINIINRPDNMEMIRLLDVRMIHIDDIEANRISRVVMVDSQPDHHEVFARFSVDAIVDHHPNTGVSAAFVDIRPDYGATASIMTEYLKAAKIKPSVKLATALFYAIKTDTANFERRALVEDLQALRFLFQYANLHLVQKIEAVDIRPAYLAYFRKALRNMIMREGTVYVHLGPVVNPDVCVLVADFFMRVSSVKWSIVSGTLQKKLIVVFRNDGLRKSAGTVAKEVFGDVGVAGGHKSMARAEVSVAALYKLADHRNYDGLSKAIIRKLEKGLGKELIAKDLAE